MASTVSEDRVELGYGPQGSPGPFSDREMDRLSEALTMSSWETGIDFSVYIGDLGQDRRATLADLHRTFGASAANTCLIAVSPNEKVVEIGVGDALRRRLPDRSCNLAVLAMTANFQGGDLVGGIVNGLRSLADQAGQPVEY